MDKKFISSKNISNYEILTEDGFKDVIALHKTIPYDMYNLVLESKELKCADFHIVFLETGEEIFVKDLIKGNKIKTVDGVEEVLDVINYGYEKEMYDFELGGDNFKYYTNGILSHNTTLIRKLVSELAEDKTIIYVPSYFMADIANPELISFISKFRNSVLLLEDAESILTAPQDERTQAVTNILNISDGLLNDHMDMQIIATFNTGKKNVIDDALLRKGRLMVDYKFKKLTAKQATKLSKHIGQNKEYTEPKSLAEIYEEKNSGKQLVDNDVNTQKIGFQFKKNE